MKTMRKLMIVAMLVASAAVANAQRGYDRNAGRDRYDRVDNYDRIDSYQREARRQIAWGIESGRITSRESKRLLREVEQIEYKENRYKRDGVLDPRERRDLMEDLTVLNRWINREKRDGDRVTYEDFSRSNRGRYDDRYNRRY
ncbi:hypothetical protein [Emticicia oligotrophica]|uniref:hypothetical protein n=1 Tax=Emticicia oligotrophica TaxID=312279 RepID=UPI00273C25A0|nr:hypothetical protein [Emticicia oligotrophica]